LIRAHPVLPVILTKLFQLLLLGNKVPTSFGYSYIVPLPKPKVCINKAMTREDFRGIAISRIISKKILNIVLLFGDLLQRFGSWLQKGDRL